MHLDRKAHTCLGVLLSNFYLLGKKIKDYRTTKLDGKKDALMCTNLTRLFPREDSRSL